MGVLTMLYVIGAILVYMFFITPELYLAKWIVIGVRRWEGFVQLSVFTGSCVHAFSMCMLVSLWKLFWTFGQFNWN